MTRPKSAEVVWELNDDGTVVVDVPRPRPFGAKTPGCNTPARGVNPADIDTDVEGEPVTESGEDAV